MHIDHSKLVELLVETSGIEKENIENQLADLVKEINEAIEEGEAYEIEGFGVFSAIGENVVFIPADELATEINYKYVGMEALELDDASGAEDEPDAEDNDDPFAGLLDDEPEMAKTPEPNMDTADDTSEEDGSEEEDSPFDLDDETDEGDEEEEKPGPDKWGIDTYKDEGAETMFSGLLGDSPDEETEQEEEHFKAVFDQEDDEDEDLNRISEIERELAGKSDDDSDDEQDPFAALADVGSDPEENETSDELDDTLSSAEEKEDDEETDDLEKALSSSIDETVNEDDDSEPVPVIKNLTSAKGDKKGKDEEKSSDKKKETKRKPFKRPQKAKDTGGQSAILLIIIIILVLGGGIYGLGYFGVVNIPGITPTPVPTTTQTTPPAPTPDVTDSEQQTQDTPEPVTETTEAEPTSSDQNEAATGTSDQEGESANNEMEQATETQVTETTQEAQDTDSGEPASYGLTGSLNEAANNGYTIVVYSLTNEDNARAKVSELTDQGYRVILAEVPHQQYGTLWRVSLGQFETMRDAAVAAQELGNPFTDNYFVTQIQ
jgi:cell division septation protein DedD